VVDREELCPGLLCLDSWLVSVTLYVRSWGRWFDSRSPWGRYQVVNTKMSDCRWTDKPSGYETNTKLGQLSLHLFEENINSIIGLLLLIVVRCPLRTTDGRRQM